jgi:hypothetical protein
LVGSCKKHVFEVLEKKVKSSNRGEKKKEKERRREQIALNIKYIKQKTSNAIKLNTLSVDSQC